MTEPTKEPTLEDEIEASGQTFEQAVEAALEKDAAPREPEPEKVAGEVYDEETERIEAQRAEIVPYEETPLERHDRGSMTPFGTNDPAEVIARASAVATALMDAVNKHDKGKPPAKRLVSNISGRDFPKVECWTLLGTMLGVFPVLEGEPKHVEID